MMSQAATHNIIESKKRAVQISFVSDHVGAAGHMIIGAGALNIMQVHLG